MDRRNYYYGQIVQEDELDVGFANGETADWKQNDDVGLIGIQIPAYDVPAAWPALPNSWTVDEAIPPSWKVSIDTGYAYNKDGKRLAVDPPTTVELDCEKDFLGVNNSVGGGNERWISIFLKYTKTLSDPRVDDLGATVYFVETESYELECRQGAEVAAPATEGNKPALDSTSILLADILIDNGMPPINTADINPYGAAAPREYLLRTERLMNLDVSGLLPAWFAPATAGDDDNFIRGRNLDEVMYRAVELILSIGTDFGSLGTDIIPDITCTHDLGSSSKNWKRLFVQSINETPEAASGVGALQANNTMEGVVSGHSRVMKSILPMGLPGIPHEERDIMGRRRIHAIEDFEDFMYYSGHAGPWPFQIATGGTGAIDFNDLAAFGFYRPGGYARITLPANADAAELNRDSQPLAAAAQENIEWGVLVKATTGNEYVEIGQEGGLLGINLFTFIYDPLGVVLAAPNGNWWCYYNAAGDAPIFFDTTVAYTAGQYYRLETSFEYSQATGNLMIFWHIENSGSIVTFYTDLTTALGTYEAVATGAGWDIRAYALGGGAGPGGEEILLDFYRCRQQRIYG